MNSISTKQMKSSKRESSGLLMYKFDDSGNFLFFLVHPGGPFWKNKNEGSWTIPKGECEDNEDKLQTAIREVYEETGIVAEAPFIDLGLIKQKSGKKVFAWALKTEFSGNINCTSTCEIEYPPKSGKIITIPEIDKGCFFSKTECEKLINSAQFEFIEKLEKILIL